MFLSLDEDPDIRPLLTKLRIDRFDVGNDGAYDTVRDMRNWVQMRSEAGG